MARLRSRCRGRVQTRPLLHPERRWRGGGPKHLRTSRRPRRLALQCYFVSFAIEMHCGLPLPQHPFLHCAVPLWTTSIDQLVLTSIRPARATISIGCWAASAAPHWMRRADRLCVASLTLYFVRQRPDTKGAPPLYLTPLPKGSFPWCPPDWYRYQRTPTGHATLGGEIAPALTELTHSIHAGGRQEEAAAARSALGP